MRLQYPMLCLCLVAFSCAGDEDRGEILVSAAISLRAPMEEISELFEQRPDGARVDFNFGASGLLAAQIRQGAPVHVFVSASLSLMENYRVLAGNELVLLAAKGRTDRVSGWGGLRETDRIAMGNPKTVPAGRYAKQCLEHEGLWEDVQPHLVYAENARQVLVYAASEDADVGITYRTDAAILPDQVEVLAPAPAGCHEPIRYGIATVVAHPAAQRFVEFCTSREASAVFARHGFMPLNEHQAF